MDDSGSWQTEVSQWVVSRKDLADEISNDLNRFFELAFENNQCPDESWFGIHKQAISLGIGGIYLAGINYKVDPINDLCPVCPNCHAMLHRRSPPLSIDELKQLLKRAKPDLTI